MWDVLKVLDGLCRKACVERVEGVGRPVSEDLGGSTRVWNVLKVLDGLCRKILAARANAVFYIADADLVEYQTAAVSYLLQIADFIGLPVIMWTAHMTGLPSVSQ